MAGASLQKMTFLEHALALAKEGFHVFPLAPTSKLPAIDDFPTRATRDPAQIAKWWTCPVMGLEQPYNVGISTTRFGDSEALLVIDVDNKDGKDGNGELLKLELQGLEIPGTREQTTPTGGRHIIFRVSSPVRQGVEVLGRGLDIRSGGGFIVGVGSCTERGVYASVGGDLVGAPGWLIDRCGNANERRGLDRDGGPGAVDPALARSRGVRYLESEAPLAIQGDGGDQTTFSVACRLMDLGCDELSAYELLLDHWNDRCEPPWSAGEISLKVQNAARYRRHPIGSHAPELDFVPPPADEPPLDEVISPQNEVDELHPIEQLNKEFAFVVAGGGGHILWETVDHHGKPRLEHLGIQTFHQKLAAVVDLESRKPLTEVWMRSKRRRDYDGICFRPGLETPPRFYNLWKGFTYAPFGHDENPSSEARESVEAFLDHALTNVCRGEDRLFKWLIGYFAHLVQRPWEKPLVALVFRGGKGTGKNALIERIGTLLGGHFLLTSNRRYLIGNFNGHLENCLLFALDEAFWSGDKQAEGTLKDLITGKSHVIEHKGKEPYTVENCTRVAIIGNEDWLVPASQDERRFAVFDVGDGRKQDRAYFQTMREGMERGGYRVLLRYLLDFNLTGIELNDAPRTLALLDQKVSSLDPFYQWWLESLGEGKLVCADFGGDWPTEPIDKDRVRNAFRRYTRDRNIKGRIPEDRTVGKLFHKACPKLDASGKRREGGELINTYKLPPLAEARTLWETFIGHAVPWE
jgi:hypothetical protein